MSRRKWAIVLLTLVTWRAGAASAAPDASVSAQVTGADASTPLENDLDGLRKPGTVLTYYGLRKLELESDVSDEEKLKEWQAFIVRSADQIEYAKKAVERWRDAARQRLIEQVESRDHSGQAGARDKVEGWQRILDLYPRSPEAKVAKKRAAFWRAAETQRLVRAAEDVERGRGTKVERIIAWQAVVEWVPSAPEARAASKRMLALQAQLFQEAQSLDKIPRVDAETKIAVWRDVLAAAPTKEQRGIAERRIAELSVEARQQPKR